MCFLNSESLYEGWEENCSLRQLYKCASNVTHEGKWSLDVLTCEPRLKQKSDLSFITTHI